MSRALAVVLLLVGCSDPVVSLDLQPPIDQAKFDTSCVTNVELYADGANYPGDSSDFKSIELKLDHPAATYAELLAELHGKFDLPIPDTGLHGIEFYGWNGDSGFGSNLTVNPELAFLAVEPYAGGDQVTVPIVPNMSCARSAVTVRPLDLVPFLASSPRACSTGALTTAGGTVTLGTLTPALYTDLTYFWGGVVTGAIAADGTAALQGSTTVGPASCIAALGGVADNFSTSCLTGPGVCGRPGEYELGVIDGTYYANSIDPAIIAHYKGFVVGAVFDTSRASVAGATVDFDQSKGQLVFVDLDPAAQRFKPVAGATSTTASGLFLIYTNELLDVTIANAAGHATVRMGTPTSNDMVSTVVL